VIPSDTQKEKVLARMGESRAICIDHGNHWYTTQFHPESRKSVWSCMYEQTNPEYIPNYSDDQEGVAFVRNFLNIASRFSSGDTN
jgi:GMP synthase-like glutamine amidotransferase